MKNYLTGEYDEVNFVNLSMVALEFSVSLVIHF